MACRAPQHRDGHYKPCLDRMTLLLQYLAVTSLLRLIQTYEHYKARYGPNFRWTRSPRWVLTNLKTITLIGFVLPRWELTKHVNFIGNFRHAKKEKFVSPSILRKKEKKRKKKKRLMLQRQEIHWPSNYYSFVQASHHPSFSGLGVPSDSWCNIISKIK